MRQVCILLVVLLLAACAQRGALDMVGRLPPQAVLQPVWLASNRAEAPDGTPGAGRGAETRFARLEVSIPPTHETGRIAWSGSAPPDPARHFVLAEQVTLPGLAAFADRVAAQATDEVMVFVHGYNTNYAEAAYRAAQIAHDFRVPVPFVAFSWPSAGDPRDYAYDRDSVIYSRDALESLLLALTERTRVLLLAHSMGSQLVMETLRQMSIGGQHTALTRLSGVGLISPDIDEEVFRRQAERITPFPQPFALMVSHRDRVLGLSALLAGKPQRLGSISDPQKLGGLPVEVVDLSGFRVSGDAQGHNTAFASPAAIAALRRLAESRPGN